MDKKQLQKLVQETPMLMPEERRYWLEHLPTMSLEQCARLETILNEPVPLPFAHVIEQFFQSLVKGIAA